MLETDHYYLRLQFKMDFQNLNGENLNISEQLNRRIPIERWDLLKPNQNFNFGKKFRETNERNDRVVNWLQPSTSKFHQQKCENLRIKRRNREVAIPRPIKLRRHFLPLQKILPVGANASCFNLPSSFFSGATLGITPQHNIPRKDESTLASGFLPQVTSTPLSSNDFFSNDMKNPMIIRNDYTKRFNLSYGDFLASFQDTIKKSGQALFPNNATNDTLSRLRAAHKTQSVAPQTSQELIRTEAADLISQKRAKLSYLRKGSNRNLPNPSSDFTFLIENDYHQHSETSEYSGKCLVVRENPDSPDFTLSRSWIQQADDVLLPSPNPSLAINNQFSDHWLQELSNSFLDGNPKTSEKISNLTRTPEAPNYRDQHYNLDWENMVTLSSLVGEKVACENFGKTSSLFGSQNSRSPTSTALFSLQKDFNHPVFDDVVAVHAGSAVKNSPKKYPKRRAEPKSGLEESNQDWKISLLNESLQTNGSEILRSIEHLIKESPDVKPRGFNIYEKTHWD